MGTWVAYGLLNQCTPMHDSTPPIAFDHTITGRTPRVSIPRRTHAGSMIDQFRLEHEVGSGGMGVVYAAHDTLLDRKVAIKLVHPHRQADPEERDRIVREARAMAKLSHPNVIALHSIRRWRDTYCVIMELVDGVNLGRWLKQSKRDPSEIWPVFALAGRGLQAAHDAGIVHRDFKPANVLVDACGRVKVTDFGLARLLNPEEAALADGSRPAIALPETSMVLGTPAYMAPEQFRNVGVDGRADQFSFCVALFEALFGQRPFAGDTFTQLAEASCAGELRMPDDPGRVPQAVMAALRRGLAPDRDDRFDSMAELLDHLDRGFASCRAQAALFAALARAEVALQTGELTKARGLAEVVIARAALEQLPEADARARMMLARCAAARGNGDEADAQLRRCLKSAAAAGGDVLVARAWSMLAYVAAFVRGDAGDAEAFCLAAEVAVLRADDELARAHILEQLGEVHVFLGHASEALDLLRESSDLKQRGFESADPPRPSREVARALGELAGLDSADTAVRRGVTLLETVLGADHAILAFPLDTAASIAYARGDNERAAALAERARHIARLTGETVPDASRGDGEA